jgi:cell division protein ZapA (FtsZ GTPase activity inhibitor)
MSNVAILTLAALNITSEYIKLRRHHADSVEKISERSDSLVNMIDVYLQ